MIRGSEPENLRCMQLKMFLRSNLQKIAIIKYSEVNLFCYSCFAVFGFRSNEPTITVVKMINTINNEVIVGI